MSYWNAKYPNDNGEYEITFGSKNRETAKAVEKVCAAVMDGRVESPEDVEVVVHAHWVMRGGRRYCSACGTMACVTRDSDDFWYTVGTKRCPDCGAHMDEEVTNG